MELGRVRDIHTHLLQFQMSFGLLSTEFSPPASIFSPATFHQSSEIADCNTTNNRPVVSLAVMFGGFQRLFDDTAEKLYFHLF